MSSPFEQVTAMEATHAVVADPTADTPSRTASVKAVEDPITNIPSRPASVTGLPEIDAFLESALHSFDIAFTVSDPHQPQHPIVFASAKFYELTGYSEAEVLGRNCRFLQGPETERRKVTEIRDAIREHRPCQVCILNYKKSGQPFWNQFYLSPVRDAQGELVHYVGIQADVTAMIEKRARQEEDANNGVEGGPVDSNSLRDALDAAEDGSFTVAEGEGLAAEEIKDMLQRAPSSQLSELPATLPARLPCSLLQPLLKIQQSFVLVDPRLPDMPIIHASDTFLRLTEWPRDQVVGHNCRFLQGPGTDLAEVAKIREAITASPPRAVTVRLLNYTFSGRPFWNCLHVAPVRDSEGAVVFLVGIQLDVSRVGEDAAVAPPPVAPVTILQKMAHQGVTGAIRVAVRSLAGECGLRRQASDQSMPHSHHPLSTAPSTQRTGSFLAPEPERSCQSLPVHGLRCPA